jgi:hypothetical protein
MTLTGERHDAWEGLPVPSAARLEQQAVADGSGVGDQLWELPKGVSGVAVKQWYDAHLPSGAWRTWQPCASLGEPTFSPARAVFRQWSRGRDALQLEVFPNTGGRFVIEIDRAPIPHGCVLDSHP